MIDGTASGAMYSTQIRSFDWPKLHRTPPAGEILNWYTRLCLLFSLNYLLLDLVPIFVKKVHLVGFRPSASLKVDLWLIYGCACCYSLDTQHQQGHPRPPLFRSATTHPNRQPNDGTLGKEPHSPERFRVRMSPSKYKRTRTVSRSE